MRGLPTKSEYIGEELELFRYARNWKSYWGDLVKPYLGEEVMEVGAGLGESTLNLMPAPRVKTWVCLEPDEGMAQQMQEKKSQGVLPQEVEVVHGFLSDRGKEERFDAILYLDVIEHIEKDGEELEEAMDHLKDGGYLIILVPAHNFLFSAFDKAIGHYRRYDRSLMKRALPDGVACKVLRYLDSMGFFLSLSNKMLLRQSYPTYSQIKFWDRAVVPVSRILDPVFFYGLGKSLLCIARKEK